MNKPFPSVTDNLTLLPYRVFFLFVISFFILFGDHIFFYQEKSSLFILSARYLAENAHQPGSLLLYISRFISSFYYYPAIGSLIATMVIWTSAILIKKILKILNSSGENLLPIGAGLVLFYLQSDYQYLLYYNLGIMLQLLLFYILLRIRNNYLPAVLFPFWYFFTGGFAWILCGMYISWLITKGIRKQLRSLSLLFFVVLLTLLISGEFLFYQSYEALILYPIDPGKSDSRNIVFLSFAGLLCLLPFFALLRLRFKERLIHNPKIHYLSFTFLMIIALGAISIVKYDNKTIKYFHVEKLFYENRPDEIIEFNLKNPSTNILTAYLNNIALCETGRLNDMLFSFPQSPDGGSLFLKWEIVGEILRLGGYFYYTTGMINEAQRWAYEYMVMKGHTPEGLKMLAKTSLINGDFIIAEKYISILRKSIFYRSDARTLEKFLFNENAIKSDPLLGPKFRARISEDFFSITDDPLINIERIIERDTLNRNAFEYKMAYLLLKKDLKGISENWSRLDRYDYSEIPVHIAEAGAAIRIINNGHLPPVRLQSGNVITENRLMQFLQTFQEYGTDLKKAEPALRKQFWNTYWYYVFYR